jgi:two-component system, NarL family, response regulator NreC
MIPIKRGSPNTIHQQAHGQCPRSNSAQKKIQLLIVDDHRIALDAFQAYVSKQPDFKVKTLLNGEIRAPRKLRKTAPDVVIINMRMRNPDGMTAAKLLLTAVPGAKVIGFGDLENRESVLSMLRAGARGFVSQASSLAQLFRAVRCVRRGNDFLCPAISRLIVEEFTRNRPSPRRAAEHFDLTESERQLVGLIADGRSNKEMAADLSISVRTIEKYRETLMAKLHIRSVAGLTKFAIRHGMASLD